MTTSRTIEAILTSSPEREELVVQLFERDGNQFGELFREGGEWKIELYRVPGEPPWTFPAAELIEALTVSLAEVRQRLEDQPG